MLEKVISAFLPEIERPLLQPVGSGLIHHTWKVEVGGGRAYILQEVNTNVFQRPMAIAANLDRIGRYLAEHEPQYLFAAPLRTTAGAVFFEDERGSFYRMFPFVRGSRTYDVVESPEQAYEASRQFGLLTSHLRGFDVSQLEETLPHFHDLELRYEQFERAVASGDRSRARDSLALIRFLQGRRELVDVYIRIRHDPEFTLRVTHHDTKISNVLFDQRDKGLCVIDLDTVMPGYFISDVGDMVRTYVSPASEEEVDLTKIVIRREYYQAIHDGYLGVMGDALGASEREQFFYSGLFLSYMQALRFLADHLNQDVYYGARYPGHNYYRAANQAALLQKLMEL
ncbi:MAG TPA: aminoglycoside phosphotransferase family protein [Puia sp.]|nr:aminoglycoside phosphotransferase family protein [Puia sp.]